MHSPSNFSFLILHTQLYSFLLSPLSSSIYVFPFNIYFIAGFTAIQLYCDCTNHHGPLTWMVCTKNMAKMHDMSFHLKYGNSMTLMPKTFSVTISGRYRNKCFSTCTHYRIFYNIHCHVQRTDLFLRSHVCHFGMMLSFRGKISMSMPPCLFYTLSDVFFPNQTVLTCQRQDIN